jgi:predicted DNA binding CopG/RHH family protein
MGKLDKRDLTEAEERDLADSGERGEWLPVGDLDQQRAFWKQAARQTLDARRKRISISIPERDLLLLKTRAAEEGMPYQTLINSILHKYVEG